MPYALREALAAFRRAPFLAVLSAAMVALALTVVGLFAVAAYNVRKAIRGMEARVEIVAYLRDDAGEEEVTLARAELAALPGVLEVRHVTKAEALETARRELPDFRELLTDLDVNPLPASLEVRLDPQGRTPEAVERIVALARSYPFVEDVRYGEEWLEKVFLLRRIGGVGAGILGGGFAVVAALVIGTAVRIAVYARRDEIQIMRLVGAKDGFIRRPFLLEGCLTGLAGGLAATGLTYGSYALLDHYLFSLDWLPPEWVLAGIGAGALFGTAASGLAVRRHLREA